MGHRLNIQLGDLILHFGGLPNLCGHVQVKVPEELIAFVMPFLAGLEAQVNQMAEKREANISVRAFPQVLRELAVVAVQDALDLAESFPGNEVHARLLRHPVFR